MTMNADIPPPLRVANLLTTEGVLSEIRRIYRMCRAGEMETQDLTRYANVLNIMVGIMRESKLSDRVEALEAALEKVNRPRAA